MQLSERVQRVQPSATIAISTLAREMRAAGRDVLSLSAGEPDFDTPKHVRAAAAAAMEAGDTRYTAADGTPALKRAICSKFKRDNGLEFEPSQISVGAGLSAHERVAVVSDDIYEHIYWGDEPWLTPARLWTSMRDRIITVNGVSKAYAMTGWRIGYAGANADLVGAMRKLCSQTTANPCSISQAAAAAALEGDQSMLEIMRKAFRERYDYLYQAISAMPGMRCARAQGAFYLFVDAREAIRAKGLDDDAELAELILSEAEVALVPGSAFGAEGHLRFSFACGMDDLAEAARRIRRLLA